MLLAAHRHAGHQEGPRAVVLQNHRLRRPLARRPRGHRLARADQADAAQLGRTLRGRGTRLSRGRPSGQGGPLLHHPPRHGLRRIVHGARAGASAGRRGHHSPASPRGGGVRHAGAPPERDRTALDGQGKNRRLHRRVRAQPVQRQARADLYRRLRPDGLWHRRDHGRSRRGSARLRVRDQVRLGDSVGHRARRRQSAARRPRVLRLRHQYQFVQRRTQPQRDEDRRRDPRRVQVRRGARDRPLDRDLPDARLAHLTPALLGMSDPDRLLSARRYRAGSRRSASGPACPT